MSALHGTLHHVASSTEGWFVMSDTAIISGPHASKYVAIERCDENNNRVMLAELVGATEAWSDALETIKRQQFETKDLSADLDAKLAWAHLDDMVCRMRSHVERFNGELTKRMHND